MKAVGLTEPGGVCPFQARSPETPEITSVTTSVKSKINECGVIACDVSKEGGGKESGGLEGLESEGREQRKTGGPTFNSNFGMSATRQSGISDQRM